MSLSHAQLLSVLPFQETLHAGMCGPASVKMVLGYFGVERTEAELATLCGTDALLGTSDEQIVRAVESLGFRAEVKNESSFDDIRAWLDKGVPVLVNWFSRGRIDYDVFEVPDGHWSVVVGLDDTHIYLQDPEIGSLRTIARDDFYRVWFDFRGDHITAWDDLIIRQSIAVHSA